MSSSQLRDDLEASPSSPHSDASSQTVIDEGTPLLPDQNKTSRTPIPYAQVATLCAVRLNDPLSYSQIFPYINEYVYSLGELTDPTQVGMYSGLVVSFFRQYAA